MRRFLLVVLALMLAGCDEADRQVVRFRQSCEHMMTLARTAEDSTMMRRAKPPWSKQGDAYVHPWNTCATYLSYGTED